MDMGNSVVLAGGRGYGGLNGNGKDTVNIKLKKKQNIARTPLCSCPSHYFCPNVTTVFDLQHFLFLYVNGIPHHVLLLNIVHEIHPCCCVNSVSFSLVAIKYCIPFYHYIITDLSLPLWTLAWFPCFCYQKKSCYEHPCITFFGKYRCLLYIC